MTIASARIASWKFRLPGAQETVGRVSGESGAAIMRGEADLQNSFKINRWILTTKRGCPVSEKLIGQPSALIIECCLSGTSEMYLEKEGKTGE